MSFTRATLRHRHAVWALALAAAIFGAISYLRLPMQLFPDTSPPLVSVMTAWPGASAADVASGLVRPLEEELGALEGVSRIRSTAQDNLAVVTLELRYDMDADLAAVDVQNAVARIRGALPAGAREPRVLKLDTSDRPVLTLAVRAKALTHARSAAEDIVAPTLQQLPGVAGVDVFGGAVEAVLVELDPRRLEAWRLPLARVVEALQTQNTAAPAGQLRTERTRTALRVEARAVRPEALARIPVPLPDGSRVLIGDLGVVRRGALDDDARFAVGGERAIAVQVFKATEANAVEVVERALVAAEALSRAHPTLSIEIGEESASFTRQSIGTLLDNVWQALAFAAAVIFLFVGRIRASLVAVVSMPLSYGLTFALMKLTGTQLDMVTLTAVILAVGMVVDASVVVLENIERRRDADGLAPEEAAARGADEVRLPVLAGAATTMAVLVPLMFLGGFVGKTFGPLARTLLFAFVSSVAVALVLVPVLSLYTAGPSRLDALGALVARPFQWLMTGLRAVYLATLRGALRARLLTVGLAVGSLVLGAQLIRAQGMEVLPQMDGGSFFVSLETASGSALEETERVVRDVEALLLAEPEVVLVQSQVGFEQGMRSMSAAGAQGPTQAFVSVTLTPRTQRADSIWHIQARVRAALARVPGLRSSTVRELGNTAKSTTAAPIVVRLSGPDPLVLDRLGDEVIDRLATVPGVVQPVRSWRRDQRQVQVRLDTHRAGQLGMTPAAIAQLMQSGATGVPSGTLEREGAAPVPILTRYARGDAHTPRDVLDQPIVTPGSPDPIPLRAVARVEETVGPALVTREDHATTLDLSAFATGRALSFVLADVERDLAALTLPRGYALTLAGENRDLDEARGELGGALVMSLLAVYLLLVAQMGSFLHPLTILTSVPLSLSGVGAALWLAGKPVSMPVMVGLVLLVGTVVNSAIILVDFVNRAVADGVPRREALVASVRTRFRPIMMTSLSTVVGMIPLAAEWALGAERFSPLATAVIGGMVAATLLTLVVIPVLYDLLDDLVRLFRRLGRRLGRNAGAAAAVVLLAATPGPARGAEPVALDLAAALARARDASQRLQAGEDAVAAARHRTDAAERRRLPRFDLQARYSHLSEEEPGELRLPNMPAGVRFGEAITDSASLRVTVSQPVFTGFALARAEEAAELGVTLARLHLEVARADLDLRVTETYLGLLRAQARRAVAAQSVALVRALRQDLERLVAAGRANPHELARVDARLAEARLGVLEAEVAADAARLTLNHLTGLPPETELHLSEDLATPHDPRPAGDLHARAAEGRPDVRVASAAAELAVVRAESATAARWPQVHLQAGYSFGNPGDRTFPPRQEWGDAWDVSVVLGWTAFDFGARDAEIAAVEAEATAARRTRDELSRLTRLEVDRALNALEAADARIAAARASVTLADRALTQARELHGHGRLVATELLDREVALARARVAEIDARVGARLAQAHLRRLTGGHHPSAHLP